MFRWKVTSSWQGEAIPASCTHGGLQPHPRTRPAALLKDGGGPRRRGGRAGSEGSLAESQALVRAGRSRSQSRAVAQAGLELTSWRCLLPCACSQPLQTWTRLGAL